jgi:RNA polymerase sigma factor (sigma-70 family)
MTQYTPEQEVAWIRQIIRHVAVHTRRQYTRWGREELLLNGSHEDGEERMDGIPDAPSAPLDHDIEGFETLSEPEKTVLYGLYWEGRSQRELSRHMGLAQTTISKIHRQAIRKLKEQLSDER